MRFFVVGSITDSIAQNQATTMLQHQHKILTQYFATQYKTHNQPKFYLLHTHVEIIVTLLVLRTLHYAGLNGQQTEINI